MSGELKPCPFCGDVPIVYECDVGAGAFGIKCPGCGAEMFDQLPTGNPEFCAEVWNTRATDHADYVGMIASLEQSNADHAARVAELEAEVAQCFRIAGADGDGAGDERLAERAVQAVTDLRRDYDEACEEAHQLRQRAERAEAEAAGLREALARVCDQIAGNALDFPVEYRRGAGACAAAIRAGVTVTKDTP